MQKIFFTILISILVFTGCQQTDGLPKIKFIEQSVANGISIRGSSAVNNQIAWFSGTKGRFAKTTDGGKTWIWDSIQAATNLDFRDIHAFSDKEAIVLSAGAPAKIFKTTDGGKSWTEKHTDTTEGVFFNSMDFWDKNNGIAVSDPLLDGFLLIKTGDGGETWSRIPVENLSPPVSGEAEFAASGTCITTFGNRGVCFVTGGSVARVFISNDMGNSWKVTESPIMKGNASKGIFSVCFDDKGNGVITGGDYKEASLKTHTTAYTTNQGQSWLLSETSPPSGFNSCVAAVPGTNSKQLIALGTEGVNLSVDGGKNWKMIHSDSFNTIVFAPNGKHAWAAGSDGKIVQLLFE